jgi:hypothetical protein
LTPLYGADPLSTTWPLPLRRALAALCLASLATLQLATREAVLLRKEQGAASLPELQSASGTRDPWLVADLRGATSAARDPHLRRLTPPAAWPTRLRQAPHLLVFIDGERIAFLRDGPVGAADQAFYERLPDGQYALTIQCDEGQRACREVTAVPDDRWLEYRVSAQRLRVAPGVASGLAMRLGFLLALFFVVAGTPRRQAAGLLVMTLGTAAWLGLTLERASAALAFLGAELLLVSLAALRDLVRGVRPRVGRATAALEDVLTKVAMRLPMPAVTLGFALLVYAALLAPMVTAGCGLSSDWSTHLYYVCRQQASLRELLHPSHFLHNETYGAFYPYFAFYGGTLYAWVAVLALAVGPTNAFLMSWAAGMAIAYSGWTWLSRLLGVRGACAYLPGVIAITSSYYLSDAYGRGFWGEFMATSAIPMVVASVAALVREPDAPTAMPSPKRARRLRTRLALFASVVLLTGSHSLTLLWGTTFVAGLTAIGLVAMPPATRWPALRNLCSAIPWAALGVGLNAWFLAPLAAWGRATHIASYSPHGMGSNGQELTSWRVVFDPGRSDPSTAGYQLSIYALAWALLAALALWRGATLRERFGALAVWTAFGAVLSLIMTGGGRLLWACLPRLYRSIQFEYRLHTYATCCVVLLVILGLRGSASSSRRNLWRAGLGLAVVAQSALAMKQLRQPWCVLTLESILEAGASLPPGVGQAMDYRFMASTSGAFPNAPVLSAPPVELKLDVSAIHRDRASIEVAAPVPDRLLTNISWSPLMDVTGDLAIAGRTAEGLTVLRYVGVPGAPAHAVASPALPAPVRLGALLSMASAFGVVLLIGRERRRAPTREASA